VRQRSLLATTGDITETRATLSDIQRQLATTGDKSDITATEGDIKTSMPHVPVESGMD